MKLKILLLLFTQIAFCQTNELSKMLQDGNKAFVEKKYLLSKEIFTKATNAYPKDIYFWYNLAASELNLGETENACEHFYQAYLNGDQKVIDDIRKYCPSFRNGSIISIKDVENPPKFIYDGKEYLLFKNERINDVYINFLTNKMRKSNILYSKLNGKVWIIMKVNKLGIFEGNAILTVKATDKNDVEIVTAEIMSILKNAFTYVSAKNKGQNVALLEGSAFSINFNR